MRSEARRPVGGLPGTNRVRRERRGAEQEILSEWNYQDSVFGGGRKKGCSDDSVFLMSDQVEVASSTEKGKEICRQGKEILTLAFNMLGLRLLWNI